MTDPKMQSLIPTTTNASPDYFCTWNIQGYYASYVKGAYKDAVGERRRFGQGRNENWLDQFAKVRQHREALCFGFWVMAANCSAQKCYAKATRRCGLKWRWRV